MNQYVCEAINKKQCIEINYHGFIRVVEPHVYGLSKIGNEVIRAYQIRGGNNRGKSVQWKLFKLNEIISLRILSEKAQIPRQGYKLNDTDIPTIYCQV